MPTAFQSAPAIAGGRCATNRTFLSATCSFNPRPPLLAGDATPADIEAEITGVSIRARHCWRAMPDSRFESSPISRFNPRPPLLAGDAPSQGAVELVEPVSIRARHCWRAMPASSRQIVSSCKFQSAPAIAGGRCRQAICPLRRPLRFNPRPPLLAGDARRLGRPPHQQLVSIRARHCWRAMHRQTKTSHLPQGFQSAPAIAGGRCCSARRQRCWKCCFNPRPPLLAGDACPLRGRCRSKAVSIRARHCWRAMRLIANALQTHGFVLVTRERG